MDLEEMVNTLAEILCGSREAPDKEVLDRARELAELEARLQELETTVDGLGGEGMMSDQIEAAVKALKEDLYDEVLTADIPAEQNQCDGCKQGLRVINGLHHTDDDRVFMACTAHLYC